MVPNRYLLLALIWWVALGIPISGLGIYGNRLMAQEPVFFRWDSLPALPPAKGSLLQHGYAGAFTGVHQEVLILAGGANFPEAMPWEGGQKKYSRDIFYLLPGAPQWQQSKQVLPASLAYGVSLSTTDGILCIGGTDGVSCSREVFRLAWNEEQQEIELQFLPELPEPLAFMGGCLLKGEVYITGGQNSMKQPPRESFFYRLDARCQKWTKLPSWPGPARILPVVSCQSNGLHNQLYLFSGRLPGKTNTQLHTDGYRYDPWTQSWHRLNPIQVNGGPPLCLMGATAAPTGAAHIWVMGGDRGRIFTQLDSLNRLMMQTPDTAQIAQLTKLRNQLLDQHPGFSPQLLSYYTITDQWSLIDSFPGKLPVTTPAIHTGDRIVLASGEISPGKRSPKVIQLKIASGHQTFGWINILVVGAYFLVLIWVGWHFSKRQLSLEDYFKGGGRIPWWAAGLSIFGTVLSAISFMAIPAKTFATDWSYFVYNMGPFLVAPIIIALFLPFYQRLDITSVYEYLEQRFNVAIRLIGSLAFMAYQLGRIGIVLYLPAIALHTVSGFNIELCILTMGIISVVYTMMGGIEGVVWTDVMQVIVLMGGALLCIVLMISEIDGGFSGVWQIAVENDKFNLIDLRWNWQEPTFGVVLAAAVFSNVVFYGTDQTVVQRYLTATDMAGARRSIWTNAILVVPATIIFFAIGTILFARYSAAPAEVHPALSATDAIFPWFIVSELPPGVSGLLIAGIFAASMSSLSSSMNSVATAYTTDFHRRFSWRGNLLKVAQNSTQVAGLLGTMFAIMMASWDIKSLWDEFLKVVGLFTGGLGGVFVLGFISQKAHGRGALVGLIASMFIQYLVATSHSVHILLFTATGFLSCLIIGYLASLMLPGQPKPLKNLTFRTLDQDPES